MSARTRNAYVAAAAGFANWCMESHRLASNPFIRLPRANEKADPRRQRRTLTEPELAALLDAAQRRPIADFGRERSCRGRSGWEAESLSPDTLDKAEAIGRQRLADNPEYLAKLEHRGRGRALLYKLLTLTGLRANEARSLTVGSLDLAPMNPYVILKAADAKTRESAELPLRFDLENDLDRFIAERLKIEQRAAKAALRPIPVSLSPDTPLLDVPAGLVRILNRDMVAAGIATVEHDDNGKRYIAKRDERGRSFDVHGFRHTFNSLLAGAGVPLRTRQVLMRHASGTITDDIYSDPKVLDLRGALDKLPELTLDRLRNTQRMRATGTAGPNDMGFQSSPRTVAPIVAPTVGQTCHSEGIADTTGRIGGHFDDTLSDDANGAVDKSSVSVSRCDNCMTKSGRLDSNKRPSAPHANNSLTSKARPVRDLGEFLGICLNELGSVRTR